MKDKRVLLVGSSFSAAPIFFKLKEWGYTVAVCGNAPTDPCHQYSDESYYIDYSNPSEIEALLQEKHFDYLVPSCNDYAYMSCTEVASTHNYQGFDSPPLAKAIHTKDNFRDLARKHNLPIPAYTRLTADGKINTKSIRFPLLVKPVDSFSGRGVQRIDSPDDLESSLMNARKSSRTGEIVLEEFIEGTLHSHSAYIQDGRIFMDFIVDEFCTVYPYQVDCSNHPSRLPEYLRQQVRTCMEKFIAELDLVNGLFHTQFMVNGDKFWIIECMRRCPGDLYNMLIERSTGVDYTELYTREFVGRPLPVNITEPKLIPYGRHTISVDRSIVQSSFTIDLPSNKTEIVALKPSGERLGVAPYDKLGIFFVEFSTEEEMLRKTPRMAEHVKIKDLSNQS